MKLVNLVGSQVVTDQIITQSIGAFALQFNHSDSGFDALKRVKLTLSRLSSNGEATGLIYAMSLMELLEIQGHDDGSFIYGNTTTSASQGIINLSAYGTCYVADSEQLVLSISGTIEGDNLTLYGFETGSYVDTISRFTPVIVQANLPRVITVGNADRIVMPKNSIGYVVFHYSDGRSVKMTETELGIMSYALDEAVMKETRGGASYLGYYELIVMDVSAMDSVEIVLNNESRVYLIEEV